VQAAATDDATRNGYSASSETIAVHTPPISGAYAGNAQAVEVLVSEVKSPLLSVLYLGGAVNVSAHAVAAAKASGGACVLALDPSASSAVDMGGSTIVNMPGCTVAANSTNNAAVTVGGSSTLTAESVWTAGGYTQSGSADVGLDQGAVTHAWPLADPYADQTISTPHGCNHNHTSLINVVQTLDPGVYCNGINLGSQSQITLNPGTYYIDGGDLSVGAQVTLTCNCSAPGSGVTIVLTSSSSTNQIGSVTINGGAQVSLNAPSDSSYRYPGLVVFQDRRAPQTDTNRFNGGSTMNFSGAIYMPAQTVEWTGNDGPSAPNCTQVIARLVDFSGNSAMDNSGCAAQGVKPVTTLAVSLVDRRGETGKAPPGHESRGPDP
jgi:hypothetical protein